jgi:hypothetical protein
MVDRKQFPSLKSLHPDSSLNKAKLAAFHRLSTDLLVASLAPGQEGCLKTREDGTILDGHHRITVLRSRGVVIDDLPREIVLKDQKDG